MRRGGVRRGGVRRGRGEEGRGRGNGDGTEKINTV